MTSLDRDQETFSAYLNRLAQNPDDDLVLADFEEAERLVESSKGFHWKSPSLLTRRKMHLKEYYLLMRLRYKLPVVEIQDPLSFDAKDETDLAAFPLDETKLLNNLKIYLAISMKRLKPRKTTWTHPRYQSLVQRRQSMTHYIDQYRLDHDMATSPNFKARLINSTNEVLQKAGREYGVNRAGKVKPYIGRTELPQLIDLDSFATASIDVAENHHLAWCLACVCGVRPGTLGWAKERRNDYLRWEDITITRGDRGRSDCQITFKHLKGTRDDIGKDTSQTLYPKAPISTKFIPLSIPHRLLVILLRRDALEDYPSEAF